MHLKFSTAKPINNSPRSGESGYDSNKCRSVGPPLSCIGPTGILRIPPRFFCEGDETRDRGTEESEPDGSELPKYLGLSSYTLVYYCASGAVYYKHLQARDMPLNMAISSHNLELAHYEGENQPN